jgi:hypothetical protein
MDGREDAAEQRAADGHLSKLESDRPSVANDPCANFDEPGLQAGQRPVGYLLRQISTLQEDAEIVGQRMKLQADLVLRHALAGETRPVDRLFAFLDALPGSVCLHTREGAAQPCHADCRTG